MEYSVKHMPQDEFYLLLDSFSKEFLKIPIIKEAKHFAPMVKGFRLNKLPQNKLYKIYYDEISIMPQSPLEHWLLKNIETNFEKTRIPELVDNHTGSIFQLGIALEEEIKPSGLNISPHTILLIGKYDCNDESLQALRLFHDFLRNSIKSAVDVEQQIAASKISELNEANNQFRIKLLKEKEEIKRSYEAQYAKLSETTEEMNCQISELQKKNDSLNKAYIEATRMIDTQKQQLHDYSKTRVINKEQEEIIIALNAQISQMNDLVQELQSKTISPDEVLEICEDIIEDLKATGLSDDDLRLRAKEIFSENTTISEAWKAISETAQSRIEYIVDAMKKRKIISDNIDVLDEIENGVCIKYLIIKSLKVLFFKYLEQTTAHNSIEKHFISEE